MSEYRTPEEDQARDQQQARIREVIDQAVTDGASLIAAMALGEPQDVVELWTNRLWNGLRDGLVDGRPLPDDCPHLLPEEDRLAAIVYLIQDRIFDKAEAIRQGLDDA